MPTQLDESNLAVERARDLRQCAEEKLRASSLTNLESLVPDQAQQLFHELRVHQIELEMQNEELRHAQEQLATARARYFDLYDLAPVGYLALSEQGLILEANLTAATLFGVARDDLVKQPFSHFIVAQDQDVYYQHRHHLFATGAPQTCELRMIRHAANDIPFWAHVQVTLGQDSATGAKVCRAVLSDVTERKYADEQLRASHANLNALIENTDGSIWAIDRYCQLIVGNEMFQRNVSAALGRPLKTGECVLLPSFPAAANAEWQSYYDRVLQGERFSIEAMTRFRPTPEYIEYHFTPILDTTGAIQGATIFGRNITERKLAQAQLEYQANLLNEVNDAVVASDANYVMTMWNRAAEKMYGWHAEEVVGKNGVARLQTAFPNTDAEEMRRTVAETGDYHGEVTQVRKDGTRIPVDIASRVLHDADGKIIGYVSVNRDITERKRIETELRLSEERHRLISSRMSDYVYAGRILPDGSAQTDWISGAFEQITGYTPEEIKTLPGGFGSLVMAQDLERVIENQARLFACETVAMEYRIRCKNGEMRWLYDYMKPSVDEAIPGGIRLLGAVQDITERKRAEQSLVQANERLALAQRSSGAGVWDWDMATGQLSWTPEFFALFGVDSKHTPSFEVWRATLHPHDLAQAEERIAQAIRDHVPLSNEYRIILANGEVRWINALGDTIYNENGQPTRMTGICVDVTKRKRQERELEAIVAVSGALRTTITRDEMMPVIVEQIAHWFNAQAVAIGSFAPTDDTSWVMYANGDWAETTGMRVPLENTITGRVLMTGKPYVTNDLAHDPLFYLPRHGRHLLGATCVPLIAQGQAVGWLAVGMLTSLHNDDVRILNAIADIAANAIRRATLHERTQQTAHDLERAYETTLEGWASALELRDQETEGHTRRVLALTLKLAQAMGIAPADLTNVRRGALLHDIGKMGIPDSVLLKPGTLNEREWEIMRRHPEYAYRLLSSIEYLRPVLDIPYCHHEKWDGTGYPRGLKGEEIPLVARIFTVVDVWDALCSDRPYRVAWTAEQARAYIQAEACKSFDPQVVEQFLVLLGEGAHA